MWSLLHLLMEMDQDTPLIKKKTLEYIRTD